MSLEHDRRPEFRTVDGEADDPSKAESMVDEADLFLAALQNGDTVGPAQWLAGREPRKHLSREDQSEFLGVVAQLHQAAAARKSELLDWTSDQSRDFAARELPLPRGASLGNYEIVECIGAGGMGCVYRARNRLLKQDRALKVLPFEGSRDEGAVERFKLEIGTVGNLNHVGIVRATDAGIWEGMPYLVMDLVAGSDLKRLVRDDGPFAIDKACRVMRKVAEALEHIHARGIVHRDVKPSNIMLDDAGQVTVLDLGLAKDSSALAANPRLASGRMAGTIGYMAPEQRDRPDEASPAADIYGLGCTLFYLLSGRPPTAADLTDPLATKTPVAPRPIQILRPDVSDDLARLLDRLLAEDPRLRPASMKEVAAALSPFCPSPPAIPVDAPSETPDATPSEMPSATPNAGPNAKHGRVPSETKIATLFAVVFVSMVALGMWFNPWTSQWRSFAPSGIAAMRSTSDDDEVPETAGAAGRVEPETIHESATASSPAPRRAATELSNHGAVLVTRCHTGEVFALEYSPDGRRLATAGNDRIVRIWDVGPNRCTLERALVGHSRSVQTLAWSRDGRTLLSGDGDRIRIWDVATGLTTRSMDAAGATLLALAPDGRTLAYYPAQHSGLVVIDFASLRERRTLTLLGAEGVRPFDRRGVTALTFTPDSRCLIVAENDAVVRVRDIDSGAKIGELSGHNSNVSCLLPSPDGRILASCASDGVRLWDLKNFAALDTLSDLPRRPVGLAWASNAVRPDARSIPVVTWRDESHPGLHVLLGQWGWSSIPGEGLTFEQFGMNRCVRMAEQGTTVAGIGGSGQPSAALVWDVASGHLLQNLRAQQSGRVWKAGWSTDNQALLIGQDGDGVDIWTLPSSGVAARRLALPVRRLRAWAMNRRILAVAGEDDRKVSLWNSTSGEFVRDLEGHENLAYAVDLSSTGRIASGGEDRILRVWDADSGRVVSQLRGHEHAIWMVRLSDDGRWLASVDDQELRVWDVASSQLLKSLPTAHRQFAWSPNGGSLAFRTQQSIQVWDRAADSLSVPFARSDSGLLELAWQDDGRNLVGSFSDGRLRIWDVQSPNSPPREVTVPDDARLARDGRRWSAVDAGSLVFGESREGASTGKFLVLEDARWLAIDNSGHYRSDAPTGDDDLVYVVNSPDQSRTLTPAEFAREYDWTNDPESVWPSRK